MGNTPKTKRAKKKVTLFERIEITDSEYAQKVYDREKGWITWKAICTVVAALGSICGWLVMSGDAGEMSDFGAAMCSISMIAGWVAFVACGAIFKGIRVIWAAAVFGYVVVPFAFVDLIGFLFGGLFGLLGVVLFPVVPCAMSLYQSWRNFKDTELFLAAILEIIIIYYDCVCCDQIGISTWNSDTYGEHKLATAWTTENGEHFHMCTVIGCGYAADKAVCSGGEATCTAPSACDTCGQPYGTTADHEYKNEWNKGDANGHWHDCANCTGRGNP